MGVATLEERAQEFLATTEELDLFHERFSRCRGLLHFLACRVLGSCEQAQLAIENCWLSASQNAPRFDREGAFRSWLMRVLVTEALAILHQRKDRPANHGRLPEPAKKRPATSSEDQSTEGN
jgi:DNA-directed RNA polymerase specialized sigma24 family protein